MLKIFYDKTKLNLDTELVLLAGILDKEPYVKPGNQLIFSQSLIDTCKKRIQYVEHIEDSDIVVIPYKFNGEIPNTNKKVFAFYNHDNPNPFHLPENITLFRTSMYKSNHPENEKIMPPFSPEPFKGEYLENPELSIGFCGQIINKRQLYLKMLHDSHIKTDFIIRPCFWGFGYFDKVTSRIEFINNIKKNIFNFCYRGDGNFSYRFYETMMLGRIPVLIDTDCEFPIDIKECCVYCLPDDNIIEKIEIFYKTKDLLKIQKNNRMLWEKYLSPVGWINNLLDQLM